MWVFRRSFTGFSTHTDEMINEEQRAYLQTLPAHIRLDFEQTNNKLNVLLVYGIPRKVNKHLFEDRDEKGLMRIMEQADSDVLCFRYTHKPYYRILISPTDGNDHYRNVINIGSVVSRGSAPVEATCF
jgi:hypothetical protein